MAALEVIMREPLSGLMLPGWDRRSVYGWDEDEASWWAQLWHNDRPDDPVADAPHVGFGPLYGQRIGDVSLLIRLIAQATGYDFDTVDQVMLAVDARDGSRLEVILPSGDTYHGTCRSSATAEERHAAQAAHQPLHANTLELDNGQTIRLYELAFQIGQGEVRIGLSHEPRAAG